MYYINMKANAKINLTLDVLNKRSDGYHNLITVMQTIKLHDKIFIKKINTNNIKLSTNLNWLPIDNRNLAYRAAKILIENYNINSGVFINIKKYIPVSAGLGGGSSDCAHTLIGMKKIFNLNIKEKELIEIAKTLGSDVPYFLVKGTVLVEGMGDKLIKLNPHPFIYVLIVKPDIAVSTKYIFNNLNLSEIKKRPKTQELIRGIVSNDILKISQNFCNVLEIVTEKEYPIIKDIKYIMNQNGSIGSLMSGSGATVFGYFKTKQEAKNAVANIKDKLCNLKEIYITEIFNPDIKVECN